MLTRVSVTSCTDRICASAYTLPKPLSDSKAVLTSASSCAARTRVISPNSASHSASSRSLEPKCGGRRRSVTATIAPHSAAENRP